MREMSNPFGEQSNIRAYDMALKSHKLIYGRGGELFLVAHAKCSEDCKSEKCKEIKRKLEEGETICFDEQFSCPVNMSVRKTASKVFNFIILHVHTDEPVQYMIEGKAILIKPKSS